ncbi:MAG: NAD(P)H-binding protein [Candidatus Hydrogenedentes bacterium]|nr:NAD(P)H-binding protein [Candidatus Hydrogenedentota bacterium]
MGSHVVTGAFGYSGQVIARMLLERGHEVRTLTTSSRDPFAGRVPASPFHFDQPDKLVESLRGCEVLYNTYWIRFNYGTFTRAQAVKNTLTLFRAAQDAGVRRIVHVSITKPSLESPFEYFREKARLEEALRNSGMSHAILRPAILFGGSDILINNIAWATRRFPVFGVFGDGRYRVQPIHVEDFAGLAVELGASTENATVDGTGPEVFEFRELVALTAKLLGLKRKIVSMPPGLAHFAVSLIGKAVGDVILTRDEIDALMHDLLWTDAKPTGATVLSEWIRDHADTLGRTYANEVARRR